jgi:glycosyltransferase involved in cell wall biosynthesis
MSDPLVSIVIPAYNPTSHLLEAIASAAAQTHPHTEIILVNDGSDQPESLKILEKAAALVGTYLDQSNQGLGAARNAAFRAAAGDLMVPLDADDLLSPTYIATCLSALDAGHAFVYTDIHVFGTERYDERLDGYNLYRLLERNYLSYAALIRRQEWERAGGYDEAMRLGYEDWEFWLRLGARGAFGQHVSEPLFRYRKHGVSLYNVALAHHQELVDYIRQRHPELYEYKSRARIKARWSPAVSIIANKASKELAANQTIEDIQVIAPGESPLSATVLNAMDGPLDPQAAEMAALGAWSGRGGHGTIGPPDVAGNRLRRHLLNAGLLSLGSWTRHPVRSLGRLIPLRAKEGINKLAGRSVFDLSFYLQFQPNSVLFGETVVEPLIYFPKPAEDRRRVALVTTQLGPGGAEAVLYDIASTLCSGRFETLLFATQSRDDRWTAKWRERVAHVYDLARAVPLDRMAAALGSAVVNWRCDTLVLQNSLYGYAALPLIRRLLPSIQIIDVNHYLDEGWDQIAATSDVASYIDRRVALAESVRDQLLAMGTPAAKIALVRNGVDLERFVTSPMNSAGVKQILFAARLTPRKQPVLLADIARELCGLRPQRDFRFVIAGDGPEEDRVRGRVHKLGLDALFDFRGQVDDLAPLLVDCDVMILPSRSEGVPLVVLEALASARPVVAFQLWHPRRALRFRRGIRTSHPFPARSARTSRANGRGRTPENGSETRYQKDARSVLSNL